MNNYRKVNEYHGIDDTSNKHPENLPEVTGKGGSPVVDISVSEDGKMIASTDGRIHIWDFSSGRRIRTFFSPTRLTSITFTPDSKYVVTGNVNGHIMVWNASSGKIHRQFLK